MSQADHLSVSDLQENVHKALKLWHKASSDESPLHQLRLLRQTRRAGAGHPRQATNEVILQALNLLETQAEEAAHLLRMRFLDELPVYAVANQLNVAEITVHRLQKGALEHLTKIILAQEQELRAEHRARLEQRLELPTYDRLIGVETPLAQVREWLLEPDAPWLISIEGLGGLGKTSLADALCRQIIEQDLFEEVGWVSARSRLLNLDGGIRPVDRPALTAEDLIEKLVAQLMPEVPRSGPFLLREAQAVLQARLRERRHLIVIDNLETVTDLETLLPTLRVLAQPSKFLLTSRQSLHYETGLFHYHLPELNRTNALQLIRHQARLHNLPQLSEAGDEALTPIFETVGGNPLALRLVVGQTHIYPLPAILSNLATARGEQVETLYSFIYRQAWERLTELDRQVWLAMPLVPERGATLDYLSEVTSLEQGEVVNALNRLVRLNLVDAGGGLTERRYTVHNLTRTFLQEQVARWQ